MGKGLVSDGLWEAIEPLLPPEPPKPKGGRPRVDDRAALTGIVFVLKSGIPRGMLPEEMGCGRGTTSAGGACATGRRPACGASCTGSCSTGWGRPTRSTGLGLLWTRRAWRPKGGRSRRQEPDGPRQTGLEAPPCVGPRGHPARGSPHGCERPRLEDPGGGGGRHLSDTQAGPRPAAQAPREAARRQSLRLPRCREASRKRGITPRIARRGVDSSEKLGRHRWVVERTLAWLNRYRAGSRCATSGGRTSTRRSSTSAARSSASTTSHEGFATHSKPLASSTSTESTTRLLSGSTLIRCCVQPGLS